MKSFKMNSLQRLVSFILIAVLLICTVGFAANGWQSTNDDPDSGEVGDSTDKTDENTDGISPPSNNNSNDNSGGDSTQNPNENETPDEPVIELPKYKSPITGLEISEEAAFTTPVGFVLNPAMPLYGISDSDLTLEFPIENGSTRILSYTTNSSTLWKVGSLAPTRAFISSTSNFFGGIVVSYGNDDIVKYSVWDTSKIDLDISKISECYYIENTLYVYTSKELVDLAKQKSPMLNTSTYKTAPYILNELEDDILGTTKASSVILPFSSSNETELYYSDTSEQYLYFKSGSRKVDMLNGKNISFTNIFVLFSNAVTYEKSSGTELVIDTTSGGAGYYISKGYMTEIRWSVDESGALQFKTLKGEKLTVNKGNTYISYYKASNSSKVTFA